MDEETSQQGEQGLDALMIQAELIEGQQSAPAEKLEERKAQAQSDEIGSTAQELAQALTAARDMAAPLLDWWAEYMTVWSDARITAISDAGAVVMQRHGWSMGDMFSRWGPYLALISAAGLPALATYQAIKHKLEQDRRQDSAPAMRPAPQPSDTGHPSAGERVL
jgi:hypothetical protein